MNSNQLLRTFTTQARRYVGDPFPSKFSHYLYRAKLVDSLRLALRSPSDHHHHPDASLSRVLADSLQDNCAVSNPIRHPHASLSRVLADSLLDNFVVSNAIRSAPSADAALSLVRALETVPHFCHDNRTVHSLATVLAKSGRSPELKELIGEVYAGKFGNYVRFTYMNLMQWHATAGDLDSLLQVWERYRQSIDRHVCTESYNLVMHLYAQKGKDSDAVDTFYRMIDEGAIPNCRTYKVMIEHLVSSGLLCQAMEIFLLLPKMRMMRSSEQYFLLVEGFVRVKHFDKVKVLLKEMRADGILPGRAMRFSLESMHKAGFVEESAEFLREMVPGERIGRAEYFTDGSGSDDDEDDIDGNNKEEEGVRLKPWLDPRAMTKALAKWSPEDVTALEGAGFVWTSRLFCKLVRNFRSPDTAWKMFCWVACQPGFTHDIYTVQRTMTLLARHGQTELVNKLMSKIRSEGMTLPFCTIRLIIDFFGFSKNGDAALKVFRYDRDLCGSIPPFNMMVLYSSLLRTLTKCGMNSDAMDILDEMISQGICPDIQTYTGMIHHFAKNRDIVTVQKLFWMIRETRVDPDSYLLKVMVQAYCSCERAMIAWRIFEDLRILNLTPDTATKDLLVNSLWKEGRRKEAAEVEESCQEARNALPLKLSGGHIWTVSSADLIKVFDIYSNSFRSNQITVSTPS